MSENEELDIFFVILNISLRKCNVGMINKVTTSQQLGNKDLGIEFLYTVKAFPLYDKVTDDLSRRELRVTHCPIVQMKQLQIVDGNSMLHGRGKRD